MTKADKRSAAVSTPSSSSHANQRRFLGHPLGLYLVALTEFFVALSYFAVQGMFVLFLTAPPSSGGLGAPRAEALILVGVIFGFAFILPVFGGIVADRVLGHKRAVALGCSLLLIAYAVLAAPSFQAMGLSFENFTSDGVSSAYDALQDAGADTASPDSDSDDAQTATARVGGLPLALVYLASMVLALGRGLQTASTCLLAVGVYAQDDPRKDSGWTIYYGMNGLGYFLSNILIGTLGEQVNWATGFVAAAAAQGIGLSMFVLLKGRLLSSIQERARDTASAELSQTKTIDPAEKSSLKCIALLFPFFVLFATALQQSVGVVNLFVYEHVDRNVGSFLIPATWFQSLIPGFGFLCMPFFAWLLLYTARRGWKDVVVEKAVVSLLLACIGTTGLIYAASQTSFGGLASPWPIVFFAFFINAADYLFMPAVACLIGSIVPSRYRGLTMGLWLTGWGIGNINAGLLGGWLTTYGVNTMFTVVAAALAVGAIALVPLRGLWRGWSREAKRPDKSIDERDGAPATTVEA